MMRNVLKQMQKKIRDSQEIQMPSLRKDLNEVWQIAQGIENDIRATDTNFKQDTLQEFKSEPEVYLQIKLLIEVIEEGKK